MQTTTDGLPRATSGESLASRVTVHEMDNLIDQVLAARYPNIDSAALRMSTNLKRTLTYLAHREATAVYDRFGCPEAASRVLSMLWIFGEMLTRDICKLTGVSRQAVAGVLNTLEKRGLISRDRAKDQDRRQHTVRITPAGSDLIGPSLLAQNEVHSEFFSVLSADEAEQFAATLSKLLRAQSAGHPGTDGA
ncbi:MarR family transcriptional regulator [Nocardia sp. R6R-6]|uniref:MarR family transcriptional regulator n=1 Tax=Nocardia sp. R6R-6 TaxID=3459303 RepID=UPI00403D7E1C